MPVCLEWYLHLEHDARQCSSPPSSRAYRARFVVWLCEATWLCQSRADVGFQHSLSRRAGALFTGALRKPTGNVPRHTQPSQRHTTPRQARWSSNTTTTLFSQGSGLEIPEERDQGWKRFSTLSLLVCTCALTRTPFRRATAPCMRPPQTRLDSYRVCRLARNACTPPVQNTLGRNGPGKTTVEEESKAEKEEAAREKIADSKNGSVAPQGKNRRTAPCPRKQPTRFNTRSSVCLGSARSLSTHALTKAVGILLANVDAYVLGEKVSCALDPDMWRPSRL